MATHLAAVIPLKGSPLIVAERRTPTPGPNEVPIRVKSIAVNPVDHYMRGGAYVTTYPAVIGSDISGTIVASGSPDNALPIGARVAAYADAFSQGADYGGFQEYVVVAEKTVAALPDNISFNEGALLPMQLSTVFGGLYVNKIARDTYYSPSDKKGALVWGASTSMGVGAIQVFESMGFHVYATASPKNYSYLKELGASAVFNYQDPNVVSKIIDQAKHAGITLDTCFLGQGDVNACISILKSAKTPGLAATIASAPPVPDHIQSDSDVSIEFVRPSGSPGDVVAFREHLHFVLGIWLKGKLASGEFVPSPRIRVVPGGLDGIDEALNELKGNGSSPSALSLTKLVVEI